MSADSRIALSSISRRSGHIRGSSKALSSIARQSGHAERWERIGRVSGSMYDTCSHSAVVVVLYVPYSHALVFLLGLFSSNNFLVRHLRFLLLLSFSSSLVSSPLTSLPSLISSHPPFSLSLSCSLLSSLSCIVLLLILSLRCIPIPSIMHVQSFPSLLRISLVSWNACNHPLECLGNIEAVLDIHSYHMLPSLYVLLSCCSLLLSLSHPHGLVPSRV